MAREQDTTGGGLDIADLIGTCDGPRTERLLAFARAACARQSRPHDEPGCFDRVFLQWITDGLAGRAGQIDKIGIAYMYAAAWVPHQAAPTEAPDNYFHVGPHVMVVSPHQDELQAFTRDAASGMPYINHLPQRTEVFVVIPIRAWDEKPR